MSRGLIIVGLLWAGSCVALILMFRQASRIGESRDCGCRYTIIWRGQGCMNRAFTGVINHEDERRLVLENEFGQIVEVDKADIVRAVLH